MNTVYLYLELKSSQYCFIMFSVPVSYIFWQIYSYIFHTCCLYLFVANLEIQFFILSTHSATLLNTLVSFCFRVHEISYFIMSSPNKDNFVTSFPIWMPFFFLALFYWLEPESPIQCEIKVARVYSFDLLLNLRWKHSIICHLVWC